jgi:hypothetical protein
MRTHAGRPSAGRPSATSTLGPAAGAQAGRDGAARNLTGPPGAGTVPEVRTPGDAASLQGSAGNQATLQAIRSGPVVQRALAPAQAETIAQRLAEAMSGWGTDEEAIYGALSSRTPGDYAEIVAAYRRLELGDSHDLDADLADELTSSELARVKRGLEATRETAGRPAAEQAAATDERARAIAEQLRDAMKGAGTEEDQIWNALEGRSPEEISAIEREYKALTGRQLDRDFMDDLSGADLRRALDLVGIKAAGDFENYVRQEMTEGVVTAGTGKFEWMLEPEQLRVEVAVDFKPDDGVTVPLADWNRRVHDKWDQFAAVEPGGMKIPINISMRNDSSGDHEVAVHKNTDPKPENWWKDRADAGNWYLKMQDSTVPHEFGHLIGLPDEYQRTAGDYTKIVGQPAAGPSNESGLTSEEIATELHGALYLDEAKQRAPSATAILKQVGLIKNGVPQQGDFAQAVKSAYDAKYSGVFSKSLVEAMRDKLPEGSKWTIQTVFSFASRSIMGDPEGLKGPATAHDHAVEPRHMRHFLDIVRRSYPDKAWTVGPK